MADEMTYKDKMKSFLEDVNATCTIIYGGLSRNQNWNEEEKHNWYDVTITTPKGNMSYIFWDSIYNTKISEMTLEQYVHKHYKLELYDLSYAEKSKANRELQKLKDNAKPDEYDVVSCLQMYDVGTFSDFCNEFGFDEDSRKAERMYIATINEYKSLERIFTEEQLEILRNIDDYDRENEMELQ